MPLYLSLSLCIRIQFSSLARSLAVGVCIQITLNRIRQASSSLAPTAATRSWLCHSLECSREQGSSQFNITKIPAKNHMNVAVPEGGSISEKIERQQQHQQQQQPQQQQQKEATAQKLSDYKTKLDSASALAVGTSRLEGSARVGLGAWGSWD